MIKIYRNPIIIIAVSGILFWLNLQFFYFPKLDEVKILKQSLEKNRERNLRIQELAKNVDFFSNLVERVEEYHREVKSLLPKQIKLSGLLRELSLLAEKNDVTVLSIKPLESGDTEINETDIIEEFKKSDIQIILECSYENLGRYIEAVEYNNLTVMAIKDVYVTFNEKIKDPSRLKVVLTIESYYKTG